MTPFRRIPRTAHDIRRTAAASTPRTLAAVLATAALLAAAPAVASADVASSDGTTITVQGDDRNETIVLSMTPRGTVSINADDVGPGCTYNEFIDEVECPLGAGGVQVNMAGGDDHVTNLALSDGVLPDGSLRVDLGAGRDDFKGTDGREVVVGGPGNDTMTGGAGDDLLDGGDGNDDLNGGGGRDELRAGPGDDVLDGDYFDAPQADVIDGGDGNDKAVGWAIPDEDTHPAVTVTLNGAADDGRPGEGDNVSGVERITSNVSGTIALSDAPDVVEMWANLDYGSSRIATLGGNDVVTGGNAVEAIDGGAGDDRLEGGFGDDTIVGGPGRDTIVGDKSGGNCGLFESCSMPVGNDTIDARDGEADSVSCGVGEDRVSADAVDTVAADCEQVDRARAIVPDGSGGVNVPDRRVPGRRPAGPAAKLALAGGGAPSLKRALAQGLRVRVSGVKGGARVRLSARAGRRVVASGSAKAGSAGSATVTLRFARSAARSLRHGRGPVRLSIAGAGARAVVVSLRR